jgi:hypothetical protein
VGERPKPQWLPERSRAEKRGMTMLLLVLLALLVVVAFGVGFTT